jgi:type II secretory pathway component PulF
MALYKYKAFDQQGKVVSGLVEASTEEGAADALRDKGLNLTALKKKLNFDINNLDFFSPIKPKEIVIFSRQFSVLTSANVALVHSLKLLVDQVKSVKLKKVVAEIASDVDGGSRLSDALGKFPKQFSSFYVSVVRAGETSGKLDEVLNYLADELEKDYDMNSKIKGAMIYPAVVVTGLVVVGAVMMIFVVPKLTDVIASSGGELPLPTKILIAVSDFLQAYWPILLFGAFGAYFSLKAFLARPLGKLMFDSLVLKLPVFGNLYKLIYVVRFTRSMNTLILGGVSLSRGLDITAEVVSNDVYKKLILDTKKEVEDGNSISSVFKESKDVPVMVSQMMAIGEKTGKLDTILNKITDFYTREINNIIANLMILMEPIIIILIGIGVGTMVAAIILPMYQMADSF